ncbi:GntR family transcriptional regulator [Mycetocola saprophilus]|uniref:GntR family transcriptional regulator n=1 Tax=Mycetocola saprophilus TaxID=76636 RepID=UPI0004BFDB3C|nr:GntR family transcriptional regulator [Mycetocola saprophilus]
MPRTGRAPIRRRLLRDEIYDTILNAILDGTLEAGEQLHDEELLTWLGTSRTPIREALNRLAENGIVELVPHKYTRVVPLDFRNINEAIFTTGVLHEHAARKTVGNLSADQLAELQGFAEDARACLKSDDLAGLGPAIRDFFLVFEQATGNRIMVETVEGLSLQLLRFLTPREGLTGAPEIVEQLEAINAAAHTGDAAATGDLIYAMYEPTRRNFIETFRGQD